MKKCQSSERNLLLSYIVSKDDEKSFCNKYQLQRKYYPTYFTKSYLQMWMKSEGTNSADFCATEHLLIMCTSGKAVTQSGEKYHRAFSVNLICLYNYFA
jgi:hypothetical protein